MNFEIWNYPHVETLSTLKNANNPSHVLEEHQPPPEPTPQELELAEERLAHTKALTQHLAVVQSISQAMSKQFDEVSELFLTNITTLVKNVTEKVIQKELAMDDDRMLDILQRAVTQIRRDMEPCTIFVATEHYLYLSTHTSMPPDITLKLDPTLQLGEFRVKTAYSELESILEHRLNELFGLV